MSNYTPDIVIYHDNCMDGFTAAWAVSREWPDAEYVARNYGMNPDLDVLGKHVLIVDFSFRAVILRDMVETGGAASIVVLDHHKTAKDDLAPFVRFKDKPERFTRKVVTSMIADLQHPDGMYADVSDYGMPILALFDMDRSGAGIAWDFTHGADTRPELVNLVEDRDLWRFAYGDRSKHAHLCLTSHEPDFSTWDSMMMEIDEVVNQGRAIAAWQNLLIDEIIERSYLKEIDGKTAIVVDCPYSLVSETCHRMLDLNEDAHFAAAMVRGEDTVTYSLRSRDDRADVSEIAKKWGGGGHRNAAGFKVPA